MHKHVNVYCLKGQVTPLFKKRLSVLINH